MLEYVRLSNVGPAESMEAEFAPRLNLLTGDNGLGKSFLLDIAWWVLTRRWPAEVNPGLTCGLKATPRGSGESTITFRMTTETGRRDQVSKFDRAAQKWRRTPATSDKPGLVLYAQVDGSFSIWDPARNCLSVENGAADSDRLPAYVFSSREVWDGLPLEGPPVCNGLIRDVASWQRERGEALEQFLQALRALSEPEGDALTLGPLTRVALDDARDIPTVAMGYRVNAPVVHCSAGIRRVLALAYLLVWSWQEHIRACQLLDSPRTDQIVFIVDEAEAHLHPRWQRAIVPSLLGVADALAINVGVQVLAATHSPLVLASVEPAFDEEKDAWFDIDLESDGSGRVLLQKRAWVRHGDASSWLTSEAFDLKAAGSVEAESALERAAVALSDEGFGEEQALALDRELRTVLGDTNPFWIRWRYVCEKRGWLQ